MIFGLIVFVLIVYGLSNLVIYSDGPFKIFNVIRVIFNKIGLGDFIGCMMCLPTWMGMLVSVINLGLIINFGVDAFTPFNFLLIDLNNRLWGVVLIVILDGTLASGTTWFIHNVEEYFESNKKYD